MSFTHYPKLAEGAGLFGAVLWYAPGDPRNTLDDIRWRSGVRFHVADQPIQSGESISLYGSAVNFTRYYGTTSADVPLELTFAFSNEERVLVPSGVLVSGTHPMTGKTVMVDSRLPGDVCGAFPVDPLDPEPSAWPTRKVEGLEWPVRGIRDATDEDLPHLNYDGIALVSQYRPAAEGKPAVGDKTLVTIYGSALKVTVKNTGDRAGSVRVFVRGSVF